MIQKAAPKAAPAKAARVPVSEIEIEELRNVLDAMVDATGEFAMLDSEVNLRWGDIYINAVYKQEVPSPTKYTRVPSHWQITLRSEPFAL